MISVIIPVLNESKTVASVVAFARRCALVSEVIVVDDGSIDGTLSIAREAGARVVTSTFLGKGASMEDGMWQATNETVVYLDGDLSQLCDDLIERLTQPIRDGKADFVKASFSRHAGRVTALTARPLLRIFFPELACFEQPLGGIIAARRSLLRRLKFETDYGVDIGLLIDASAAGAQLAEVEIGHIQHDSNSLDVLGDMASQVVRTLLNRADHYRRFNINQVREVQEVERRMEAETHVVLQRIGKVERLALFDMDGVLLKGRFVVGLAHRVNKTNELAELLDHPTLDAETRTQRIAGLFAGVPFETFQRTAMEMPLIPGANETVVGLRSAGYRVGIVTDSYHIAAEVVRRRVFADFSIAHIQRFRQGKATGQLTLSSAMKHSSGCPEHDFCKLNVLLHMLEKMGITSQDTLVVGDGHNDECMLKAAGLSIAFQPKLPSVRAAAMFAVDDHLSEVLQIAKNNHIVGRQRLDSHMIERDAPARIASS